MRTSKSLALVAGIFAAGTVVGLIISQSAPVARAQETALAAAQIGALPSSDRARLLSSTGTIDNNYIYIYFPGTEALGADEIHIVACGTGIPNHRTLCGAFVYTTET